MTTPRMVALTQCDDLVSMLQVQIRSASRLRDHLDRRSHDVAALNEICEQLLNNAVETARAAADLQDTVCHDGSHRNGAALGIRRTRR